MNAPFDRGALLASARFAALHDLLDALPADRPPTLVDLDALAAARGVVNAFGRPIRFAAAAAAMGEDYEDGIAATGAVPARADNTHDVFNALAWLAWPAAKAAINRLHLERRIPGRRGTARDVLTLFDEDGLVMLCADDTLADLLRGFAWCELFVARRADVGLNVRFLGFGHALHEKLSAPFRGLTAKVLVVAADRALLHGPLPALRRHADLALAELLASPATLASTRSLAPLPVQGIPGWWPANDDPAFYADVAQFRPGRRAQGEPARRRSPAR